VASIFFFAEKLAKKKFLSEAFANWRTSTKRQAKHLVNISERHNFYEGFRCNI
jgi:hypothetical protein